MQLTTRHIYEASTDTVFAMLTNADFLTRCAAEVGSTDARVQRSASNDPTGVVVVSTVEAPPELRRYSSHKHQATQSYSWPQPRQGRREGTVRVDIAGAPVTMEGTAVIEPGSGDTTVVTYAGTLSVKVPVMGSSLERQISPIVLRMVDAQQACGRAWLADHS